MGTKVGECGKLSVERLVSCKLMNHVISLEHMLSRRRVHRGKLGDGQ